MHRVLTIPELLDTIFSNLGHSSNLNNSLVCRSWSEIALDALWRYVGDLQRLFNILAPLREREEAEEPRRLVCQLVISFREISELDPGVFAPPRV